MNEGPHYRINVSKKVKDSAWGPQYVHYFAATTLSENSAQRLIKELKQIYGLPDFKISVSYIMTMGRDIELTDDGTIIPNQDYASI